MLVEAGEYCGWSVWLVGFLVDWDGWMVSWLDGLDCWLVGWDGAKVGTQLLWRPDAAAMPVVPLPTSTAGGPSGPR